MTMVVVREPTLLVAYYMHEKRFTRTHSRIRPQCERGERAQASRQAGRHACMQQTDRQTDTRVCSDYRYTDSTIYTHICIYLRETHYDTYVWKRERNIKSTMRSEMLFKS